MSNDLNQCSFIGRLGADPEIRYTTGGDAVSSFSIAVGSQWKDKAGEKQESTEWVSITAWGKLAEICGEYLKKGQQVFIGGRMKTEKWQDKEGKDRYTTKIVAERMQMLGSKSGDSSGHNETSSGHSTPSSGHKPVEPAAKGNFDNFDDDIPF